MNRIRNVSLLLIAVLVLLAPLSALAAPLQRRGQIAALDERVELRTLDTSNTTFQVSGTWVGTLQFEATVDGFNWVSINVTPTSSSSVVTSTTGNGAWTMTLPFQFVRVRSSSWTSGTATVSILATTARGSSGVLTVAGGVAHTQELCPDTKVQAGTLDATAKPNCIVVDNARLQNNTIAIQGVPNRTIITGSPAVLGASITVDLPQDICTTCDVTVGSLTVGSGEDTSTWDFLSGAVPDAPSNADEIRLFGDSTLKQLGGKHQDGTLGYMIRHVGTVMTPTNAVDMSGAVSTQPAKKGTVANLPATCTQGEIYFATNATAGRNLYFCTATNTWTQQTAGSGTVDGSGNANKVTKWSDSDTLGDSLISDDGTTVTLPATTVQDAGAGTAKNKNIGVFNGCVFHGSTSPAGTSEEVIYTCTVPANTLNNNGDQFRVVAAATTAANNNSKQMRIEWGLNATNGTSCFTNSTSTSQTSLYSECRIIRTSAGNQKLLGFGHAGSATTVTGGGVTATRDETTELFIVVTLANATTNTDSTLQYVTVELLQQ